MPISIMPLSTLGIAFVMSLCGVFLLTGVVRFIARRRQWLDWPGPRSLHRDPTPSVGGLAIVIVAIAALHVADIRGWWLFATGATIVAGIGLLDDLRPLPVTPRLATHFFATSLCLLVIGDVGPLRFDDIYIEPSTVLQIVVAIAVVWTINLTNFMDGVDGFVSSEIIFVGLAAGGLAYWSAAPELAIAWMSLAGAAAGFLAWNWAPAKIFMGDTGSGFLGFTVAFLFLLCVDAGVLSVANCILLIAPFFCDATFTLVRRMLSNEVWYEAHNTHGYQKLSARWGSHRRVTTSLWIVNIVLIAPALALSRSFPSWEIEITLLVVSALCVALYRVNAGRDETTSEALG